MEKIFKKCLNAIVAALGLIYILWRIPWKRKRVSGKPRLVWGPAPIINNKYWSQALINAGYVSQTLMSTYYSFIHKREDYDLYYSDIAGSSKNELVEKIRILFAPYLVFAYAVNHFDIFHHPLSGGFLYSTYLWRIEAQLLKLAGCKTVLIPYGSDAYMYSQVMDLNLRHGLLLTYPDTPKREREISARVKYWTRNAEIGRASCRERV